MQNSLCMAITEKGGGGNLAIAVNNTQHYVMIDNYDVILLCHNILSIVTKPFLHTRTIGRVWGRD